VGRVTTLGTGVGDGGRGTGVGGQLALLWMEVLAVGGDKRVRIGVNVLPVAELVPVLRLRDKRSPLTCLFLPPSSPPPPSLSLLAPAPLLLLPPPLLSSFCRPRRCRERSCCRAVAWKEHTATGAERLLLCMGSLHLAKYENAVLGLLHASHHAVHSGSASVSRSRVLLL
jgi:hypothetical protein